MTINQTKHKINLIEILKDFYADPDLRTILGFKGGTAAFLFYGLPRFSVDLDFDLLDEEKKEVVLKKIKEILEEHGFVREAREKRFTLFFLLSYEKSERTIKIEISKRKSLTGYEIKNYLGIAMLVVKQEDMVAGKLAAFLTRRKLATRDIFDLWFFLKNKWLVNEEILRERTGFSLKKAMKEAMRKLKEIDKKQLLQGLGELLDLKQKDWAREKLKEETLFYLRLYEKINS